MSDHKCQGTGRHLQQHVAEQPRINLFPSAPVFRHGPNIEARFIDIEKTRQTMACICMEGESGAGISHEFS